MKLNELIALVVSIFGCLMAGFIGSIFTMESIPTWYATLNKPFFNPPNFVFAPVWTFLYILMGVSLFLIWQKRNEIKDKLFIFGLFFTQLLLNTLWSIIFFGFKNPLFAFVEIIALWIVLLVTIIKFYKISKPASYLLIPYILWVSFATILNLSIWLLN